MRDRITSPRRADGARAEWSAYARFVARPRLPRRTARFSPAGFVAVFRLLGLDLMIMVGLSLIAGAVVAAGFELPETALAGMEMDAGMVFTVILAAPAIEEIVFRGWLSGRKRQLLGLLVLVAGAIGMGVVMGTGVPGAGIWAIAVIGVCALLAAGLFWTGRHHPPMGWFQRVFPLFFWLSTIAFACIHLFNFDQGALWVLLPLVLPQFVLGTMLGYLRVRYGLWTAIMLHAVHNGTALGLFWIGMRFAGGDR